jgi:four helix bundle protein
MNHGTQNYKDLIVWQKAISLAKTIYKLTQSLPADEKFGLVSQMRRAAVSVPSNIAEGQARRTTGEFIQFVSHAEGSAAELNFCAKEVALPAYEIIDEIRRMLNALRRKLVPRS